MATEVTHFGENSWKAAVQIIKAALAEAAELDVNEREALKTELLKEINDLRDNLQDSVTDQIGKPGGVAPLDEAGQVPSQYLPSYVDDVIEGTLGEDGVFMTVPDPDVEGSVAETITGEKGKIYVDLNTNFSYRWSGSTYVKIESIDLVEITANDVQNMWDAISVTPPVTDETVETISIEYCSINLDSTSFEYSGNPCRPTVTVTDTTATIDGSDKILIEDTDYEIVEKTDGSWDGTDWAVEEGTYTIHVNGIGTYSGSSSVTFNIVEPTGEITDPKVTE